MKYLLDTHAFLWAITDDKRLKVAYRETCTNPASELWLSVASVWEILIKVGLGKLPLPVPASAYILKHLQANRIALLPIRGAHFTSLEELPPLHHDPFDRMLVAQAISEGMTILSVDSALRKYAAKFL